MMEWRQYGHSLGYDSDTTGAPHAVNVPLLPSQRDDTYQWCKPSSHALKAFSAVIENVRSACL